MEQVLSLREAHFIMKMIFQVDGIKKQIVIYSI